MFRRELEIPVKDSKEFIVSIMMGIGGANCEVFGEGELLAY